MLAWTLAVTFYSEKKNRLKIKFVLICFQFLIINTMSVHTIPLITPFIRGPRFPYRKSEYIYILTEINFSLRFCLKRELLFKKNFAFTLPKRFFFNNLNVFFFQFLRNGYIISIFHSHYFSLNIFFSLPL